MLAAGHAIGDDGGQERLDGGERGNRKRRREQLANEIKGQPERLAVRARLGPWRDERREHLRDARMHHAVDGVGEPAVDRRDLEAGDVALEQPRGNGGEGQHQQRRGHGLQDARKQDQAEQCRRAEQGVGQADRGHRGGDRGDFLDVVIGHVGDFEAEEILHLQGGDDDANACGEARGDGERHKLDEAAQPREAHEHEQDARHERGDGEACEAVFRDDGREDHDEGGGGAGDLHARAAEGGGDAASDDGGVEAVLRGHTGDHGERHGEGNGDHADDRACGEILAEVVPGIALVENRAQAERQPDGLPQKGSVGTFEPGFLKVLITHEELLLRG